MSSIRRPGAASAAVLVGLCAAMAAAHFLAPDWARRAGLDVWNYAALEGDRQAAVERRAEMDAKAEQDVRRRSVADGLAARLAAGEQPLAAVADGLLALYSAEPGVRCGIEAFGPPTADRRLVYARHAINRVDRLLDDPARRAAVRERLEAEYRRLEAQCAAR